MPYKLLFWPKICIIVVSFLLHVESKAQNGLPVQQDEYQVYTCVLKKWIPRNDEVLPPKYSKIFVIEDTTTCDNTGRSEEDNLISLLYIYREVPQLTHKHLLAFLELNKESSTIKNYFIPSQDYEVISRQTFENIIYTDDNVYNAGWAKFNSKYPHSCGLIHLSRVAFDEECNHALVYVGVKCGRLCGEGSIIFLKRYGNEWYIEETAWLWVS